MFYGKKKLFSSKNSKKLELDAFKNLLILKISKFKKIN